VLAAWAADPSLPPSAELVAAIPAVRSVAVREDEAERTRMAPDPKAVFADLAMVLAGDVDAVRFREAAPPLNEVISSVDIIKAGEKVGMEHAHANFQ
jgi:hypothetical protein